MTSNRISNIKQLDTATAASAAATHGWRVPQSVSPHAPPSSSMAAAHAALRNPPTLPPHSSSPWSLSAARNVSISYISKTSLRTRSTIGSASATLGPSSGKTSVESGPVQEQVLHAAVAAHRPFDKRSGKGNMYSTDGLPSSYPMKGVAKRGQKARQKNMHADALALAQSMFAEQFKGRNVYETIDDQAARKIREELARMDDEMGFNPNLTRYGTKKKAKKRDSKRFSRGPSLFARFTHNTTDSRNGAEDADSDGEPAPFSRLRAARENPGMNLDKVMDLARHKVDAEMAIMDEEGAVFDYNRTNAQIEKAARRKIRRENRDSPLPSAVGKNNYHVGGGKLMAKDDIIAIANSNLQPLFTEIQQDAKQQKEAREKAEAEATAKKKEAEADKARKNKLTEIGNIFNSKKKTERKELKQKEKLEKLEKKAEKKQRKSEVKETHPPVKRIVAGATTGNSATTATHDMVAELPAKAQEAEDREAAEATTPEEGADVSPEELTGFPTAQDDQNLSLTPIEEHSSLIDNVGVASSVPTAGQQLQYSGHTIEEGKTSLPPVPPVVITDKDEPKHFIIEATSSSLHPLQPNLALYEVDAVPETQAVEHTAVAPSVRDEHGGNVAPLAIGTTYGAANEYPGANEYRANEYPAIGSGSDQVTTAATQTSAPATPNVSSTARTGVLAAAIGAVGRGTNNTRDRNFTNAGYMTSQEPNVSTHSSQEGQADLESPPSTRYEDAPEIVNVKIPPESGASAMDRVRLWFVRRRRRDISEAGRLDISDMVVPELSRGLAEEDLKAKKRRSLFTRLGIEKDRAEGFEHKVKKGKKDVHEGQGGGGNNVESRFKEEISP